jgi:Fur family zinc uptake transcriptional regulator
MARPRSDIDEVILGLLRASETPLTAYQLLDALRPNGVQSPPIVYRALDRLVKAGSVHRLEQTNAFFACHGSHAGGAVVFAVCRACNRVEEWAVDGLVEAIDRAAARTGFSVSGRTVEVRGLCAHCAGLTAEPVTADHVHGPGCGCGHAHGVGAVRGAGHDHDH